MIRFSEEDYLNQWGHTLESRLAFDKISGFIAEVCDLIYSELHQANAPLVEGKETSFQQASIISAQLYQAKYMLDNGGNFAMSSGVETYTNQLMSMAELEKRIIAPMALRVLRNAGLLYRGVH